jgi:H+-transporting ATPase
MVPNGHDPTYGTGAESKGFDPDLEMQRPSSFQHDLEAHNLPADMQQKKELFDYSLGLTSVEAAERLTRYGPNQLPDKRVPKWYIFASQFWTPMALMIWTAVIIEASLQLFPDMGILLAILLIDACIAFHETVKAGDAVAALKQTLIPRAIVKRDGEYKSISATEVVPGDLVLLGSGSAVPADCRVNEGEVHVDEAALTGESLPVAKSRGDSCMMGSTVVRGEVEGTVEATGGNTFVGRTAALLQVYYFFGPFVESHLLTLPESISCREKRSTAT